MSVYDSEQWKEISSLRKQVVQARQSHEVDVIELKRQLKELRDVHAAVHKDMCDFELRALKAESQLKEKEGTLLALREALKPTAETWRYSGFTKNGAHPASENFDIRVNRNELAAMHSAYHDTTQQAQVARNSIIQECADQVEEFSDNYNSDYSVAVREAAQFLRNLKTENP